MNMQQTATDDRPTKFKTTLYLTESNKKGLDQLTRGNRTQLINQAIAEKLKELEQERRKRKLLNLIDNMERVPANGTSTEEAVREIRTRELQNLLVDK